MSINIHRFIYVRRSSKSLRPADVGAGQQSSPFLVLRAETTVTSILNVITYLLMSHTSFQMNIVYVGGWFGIVVVTAFVT